MKVAYGKISTLTPSEVAGPTLERGSVGCTSVNYPSTVYDTFEKASMNLIQLCLQPSHLRWLTCSVFPKQGQEATAHCTLPTCGGPSVFSFLVSHWDQRFLHSHLSAVPISRELTQKAISVTGPHWVLVLTLTRGDFLTLQECCEVSFTTMSPDGTLLSVCTAQVVSRALI